MFESAESALNIRPVSRVWRRFPGELLSTIRSRGWGGETSSLSLPVWSGCQDLSRWFLTNIELRRKNISSRGEGVQTSSFSLPVLSGCQDLSRWF